MRLLSGIAGAISNCGGVNLRGSRFAGHLGDAGLTEAQYLAICHALIMPNGVRRTTSASRNTAIFRRLIEEGAVVLPSRAHALDVGASGGLDARSTCAMLAERTTLDEYVLGDLYTQVLYDVEQGAVFDEDGRLLQVERGLFFVSRHFSYNYGFQRFTNLPKRVYPWLLEQRVDFRGREHVKVLPLVHPALGLGAPGSPFRLRRMDVFEPFEERYDLIMCMHLLVSRYFDAATIERGVTNLARGLAPGGSLIVGAAEYHRVVSKAADGTLATRAFGDPRKG